MVRVQVYQPHQVFTLVFTIECDAFFNMLTVCLSLTQESILCPIRGTDCFHTAPEVFMSISHSLVCCDWCSFLESNRVEMTVAEQEEVAEHLSTMLRSLLGPRERIEVMAMITQQKRPRLTERDFVIGRHLK